MGSSFLSPISSKKLTISSEDFILSLEETLNGTHQNTTFTDEIRVNLLGEGGFIKVARADTNTEGDGALLSFAGSILENSERGVNTTTFLEKTTNSEARTLGGNQDNVNI
jgi:hypothetical protein